MSKIIEKIISSSTAPSNKNVGWWNGKELKFYTNGQWKTSGGGLSETEYDTLMRLRNNPYVLEVGKPIPKDLLTFTTDGEITLKWSNHSISGMDYYQYAYIYDPNVDTENLICFYVSGSQFRVDVGVDVDYYIENGILTSHSFSS